MKACVKYNWHLIGTPDLKYTQSETVFTKHKKCILISKVNNIYTQMKWKLLMKLNEWKNKCEQKQRRFSTYFTDKISCRQEMMAKLEAITSKMPLKLHQASSSHSVITVCMSANPNRVSMFMRRNPEESAAKQKPGLVRLTCRFPVSHPDSDPHSFCSYYGTTARSVFVFPQWTPHLPCRNKKTRLKAVFFNATGKWE